MRSNITAVGSRACVLWLKPLLDRRKFKAYGANDQLFRDKRGAWGP